MAGPGDTGAGNTASLMNATGDRVGPELDNFLRAQFNNKYVDKTTGLIKPESVNQFKKQYGNQLSPELAAELEAAQKASQATQNVTGTVVPEAQTRAKLLRSEGESAAKAVEKTPAYRLGNVGTDPADVAAEFGKVMRPGKDRIKNLKSLIASTDGDPKALEDLRAAAMESFTTKLYDQDTGVFRGKVAADRLNQNKNVYLESGLFDKEHITNMERAVEQGKKLNMHKNSAGLKRLPAETQRVLEGMAALVGAKGGALAFGSPLIGAAIGRKAMVKFVSSITTEQSKKLAYEMATNPEQFKPILERLKASNMNAEAVNLAMKAIINTVARTGVAVDERDE